jgi:large repetitive protein
VIADAPRAYWRLGETTGGYAQDEVGNATGSYLQGPALGRPGALTGDADLAVGFDGGDDRVSMGDPADGSLDFGAGDFSVEAWVRPTANDERAIASKKPLGGLPYWQFTVTDDGSQIGRIRANIFDGTTTRQAYGPAVRVDDGAWHHVVVEFDRDAGISIYVDGASAFTAGAVPGDISGAGDFLIGKATGQAQFKGDVDEVAVYAGLLSPERVIAHYRTGVDGPSDTTVP